MSESILAQELNNAKNRGSDDGGDGCGCGGDASFTDYQGRTRYTEGGGGSGVATPNENPRGKLPRISSEEWRDGWHAETSIIGSRQTPGNARSGNVVWFDGWPSLRAHEADSGQEKSYNKPT